MNCTLFIYFRRGEFCVSLSVYFGDGVERGGREGKGRSREAIGRGETSKEGRERGIVSLSFLILLYHNTSLIRINYKVNYSRK